MIDPTKPLEQALDTAVVIETEKQENNKVPATGFHTNPERINRNGRPKKGYSITEYMKHMLENDPTVREEIANKIADAAKKGDLVAIKLLWNYLDGMPLQATDITTLGNQIATPHVFVGPKPKEDNE